jgi:hypothetical protein
MNKSTQIFYNVKASSFYLALSVLFITSTAFGQEKSPAQAAPTLAAGASAVPSAAMLTNLTRSTMSLVNEGSKDGNFTGLYAQFSPSVQKNVDQKKLNDALANFKERKIDLSGIATTEPVFFEPPQIDQQGILKLTGMFPTQPRMVRFSLGYRQIDGKWLLELFTVDTPTLKELEAAAKAKQSALAAKQSSASQTNSKVITSKDKKDTLVENQTKKPSLQNPTQSSTLDVSTDPPTTTKW